MVLNGKEEVAGRGGRVLAALVITLLVASPMAGGIAAAVSDGWAVPIWLGGWLLAIAIPLAMAVMSDGS